MKTLKYIANIRLPTWRAHGLQIMKMCEAFASQGVKVELIIPSKRNIFGSISPFDYYGVKEIFKITRIPSSDFLGKTMSFGRLCFWLDKYTFFFNLFFRLKIDSGSIVYARDPLLLLPLLNRKDLLFLVEIHDLPRKKFFFLKMLKRAAKVITITEYLKGSLFKLGFRKNKIVVAPDGVNSQDFDISITKEESRKMLNLPQDKEIIMYIGLFDDWKGYRTILEASCLLPQQVQVVMIGGMPEQINQLKDQYPNVKFLGFKEQKKLAENQKAADILIIPNSAKMVISKFFTSPLKLFSHMASGQPVIVSDLPSLREILDESMAYFFEPDNPKSLAQAINYVLGHKDEAHEKALKSLSEAKKYTWEKRAEKILEFIT